MFAQKDISKNLDHEEIETETEFPVEAELRNVGFYTLPSIGAYAMFGLWLSSNCHFTGLEREHNLALD